MWDRRVLLVINKLVDNDENRDLREKIDSFIYRDIGNIRKFSTYSYNRKNNENTNNQDSVLCKLGDGTLKLTNYSYKFSNFYNYNQKIKYHSLRGLNSYKHIEVINLFRNVHTNSLAQSFSSSYNAILDIILNSKLTNFEKQKRIEETLMQY